MVGGSLSHYRIRAQIGAGGMGAVYDALDTDLARRVAIKLLKPEYTLEPARRERFLREARAVAALSHPNICTVYEIGHAGDDLFIVMQYVEGETLARRLASGRIDPGRLRKIAEQLADALGDAHAHGVVHRDVKPSNIMIDGQDHITIVDFGVAAVVPDRRFDGDATTATDRALTGRGQIVGTIGYLSPEQIRGEPAGAASDVFALGVTLYEAATGYNPFERGNTLRTIVALLNDAPPPVRDTVRDFPEAFDELLSRCLDKQPEQRPRDGREVAATLRWHAAGAPAGRPSVARQQSIAVLPFASLGPQVSADEYLVETSQDLLEEPKAIAPEAGRAAPAATTHVRWSVTPLGRLVRYGLTTLVLAALVSLSASSVRHPANDGLFLSAIAVMPFKDLDPGPEKEYFGAGLAADLISELEGVSGLRVFAGPSLVGGTDSGRTTAEAGSLMHVSAVLDGSIRWSGDRVRIVAHLIDVQSGAELWSQSFDGKLADVFAIQSNIARQIAAAVTGGFSSRDADTLVRHKPRNFQAFDDYLRGRHASSLRTEEGLSRAIQYFEGAVKEDPEYAAAYAGLADSYTLAAVYGALPWAEALGRARTAALRAVALDERLAEGYAALGYVQKNQWEWAAAEASFKRAIELNPQYAAAHQWYAVLLAQHARFGEALTESRAALSLEPLSISTNSQFGAMLLLSRRYEDAIKQMERTLQLKPDSVVARQIIAQANAYLGKYDEALNELEMAAQAAAPGREDQELQADRGFILAREGRHADALIIVNSLIGRYRTGSDAVTPAIATIFCALGERDQAFAWLAQGVRHGNPGFAYLKVDPRWDSLRDDRRFAPILETMGLDK
jgi:serine/threonine-protein kinase